MNPSPSKLIPSPYQLVGLTKLVASNFRGLLIADGVGVGKTISAAYAIQWFRARSRKPTIVVVPPGLVDKWNLELKLRFGISARPIRSQEEARTARSEMSRGVERPVYLLTYPVLRTGFHLETGCLVVDEIHNFRNPDSLGFKSLQSLAQSSDCRIGLSATPVNNGLADLSSIFSLLLRGYDQLAVAAAVESIWSTKRFDLLSPILTRFTKQNLAFHFVARAVKDHWVHLPVEYASAVRQAVGRVTGRNLSADSYPMEAITYFREAASSSRSFSKSIKQKILLDPDPKLEELRNLLASLRRKTLVFCQFAETVKHLRDSLPEFEVFEMTGETPVADRPDLVKSFAASNRGVMVLTSVGSEGLDLQFCDAIVNYDLHWNPMVLEQRIGRVDRIGQTKDTVVVANFHVTGSIDERISGVLRRKIEKIVGTPLSNPPIIQAVESLYDDPAIREEEKGARAAIEAQALSSAIQVDDQLAVSSISKRACDPTIVPSLNALDWISDPIRKDQLTAQFSASSALLLDVLNRYQGVV